MIIAHPFFGLVRVPALISPYRHTACVIVEPSKLLPATFAGREVHLRHFHIEACPNVQLELPL
jgi:hypothetical protein